MRDLSDYPFEYRQRIEKQAQEAFQIVSRLERDGLSRLMELLAGDHRTKQQMYMGA